MRDVLDKLLRARDCLRTGRYHELADLNSAIETGLDELNRRPGALSLRALQGLAAAAEANRKLLAAALAGLRAAECRLEEIRRDPYTLTTYDRDGTRRVISR